MFKHSPFYCGNNKNSIEVKSGKKRLGNRYVCLKTGIGVGIHLPYDPNYAEKFVPLDGRKIYCGKSNALPEGYDYLGNNHMCLQKGVSIGKKIRADKIKKSKIKKKSKKKRSR